MTDNDEHDSERGSQNENSLDDRQQPDGRQEREGGGQGEGEGEGETMTLTSATGEEYQVITDADLEDERGSREAGRRRVAIDWSPDDAADALAGRAGTPAGPGGCLRAIRVPNHGPMASELAAAAAAALARQFEEGPYAIQSVSVSGGGANGRAEAQFGGDGDRGRATAMVRAAEDALCEHHRDRFEDPEAVTVQSLDFSVEGGPNFVVVRDPNADDGTDGPADEWGHPWEDDSKGSE